jgi:hypothetical protein
MESIMEDNKDSSSAPANNTSSNKNGNGSSGAAISLIFPTAITDPSTHLTPLRDNHSAYTAVSRSCLHLNQYAGNGSSSAMDDIYSVESSALFHDATFAAGMSDVFAALMECATTHDDRRAKIIACKTLALVARSTYARIRHSPHLFSIRDSTCSRLEDEVGTDVPMALMQVALEDVDDGVAACAIESLGILTLSTGAVAGTLVEDELLREIQSMAQGHPSPHSPTLATLQDEDPTIAQMELQCRIYENCMSPRLLQLVSRVTVLKSSQHVHRMLPFLTASLVHLSKTSPNLIFGMDRATYAKRWVELNFVSLVQDVVQTLLLPAMQMQSSMDSPLAHAAALSAIRLAHACPHAPWVLEACQWASLVLQEELFLSQQNGTEAKMTALANLLVSSRAIPMQERIQILEFVFYKVQALPSTTMAPHGTTCAGLLMHARGLYHYRRPARVAFLAEIALSFFMDGPANNATASAAATNATATKQHKRSSVLEKFFTSPMIQKALLEPQAQRVTQVREELVTAFCMVAVEVGRRQRTSSASASQSENGENIKTCHYNSLLIHQEDFDEWLAMSLLVLGTFAPCLGWGLPPAYMEEELSLLVAAQAGYVRLVQEVLHSVGLLNQMSISLKMAPTASPPNMLWDQMEESAAFLGMQDNSSNESSSSMLELEPISKLMDDFVKRELKGQGIISHHMRLFLLSLAADQWVQGRYLATRKEFEETSPPTQGSQLNFNLYSAKELLVALSPRRVFSKVVESHKSQIELYGKKKKELYKKYAQDTVTVCVACIENIALTACEWRRRFGSSNETKHILSLSVLSLQGKNMSENDTSTTDAQAPVLPVCQAAIERIQAAFASNEPANMDTFSLSPLLMNTGDLKRRPVVTAARSQQGRDAYNEGYMMQLSRQIIAARIDRCLLSAPTVYSFKAGVRKQSWLRLTIPPLPASRNPQVSVARLPRFAWGSNVGSMCGGSDAAALTMAYSLRRSLRYDGEDEFRLMVAMRVHNTTAVEIEKGLRLELGIVQENVTLSPNADDPTSVEVLKSLGGEDEFNGETSLASAITVYKHELKVGEHLTWEVALDTLPMTGAITLHPTIVYREIESEPANATWVGGDKKEGSGDSIVSSGSNQSKSKSGDSGALDKEGDGESKAEEEENEHISIPGESMKLSPLIGLQPCQLVFFRDGCGDVDSFRFLWSRMTCQIPPLRVAPKSNSATVPVSHDALRLAAISTLRFAGESIPGGFVTKLWAFMSMRGMRVLCVMAESDVDSGNYGSNDKTIHVRGDDKALLCCLAGTSTAREALVSALSPGLYPL